MTDASSSAQRNWVAYVGPFLFPHGEAASSRVLGVAETIALTGRDVRIASGNFSPPAEISLDQQANSGRIYYQGLGDRPKSMRTSPIKGVKTLTHWGKAATKWLEQQDSKPSHVIVYGGQSPYAARLQSWGKRHSIPVLHDVVEWHEPEQFWGKRLNPAWISSEIALRILYKRADGIIAISSWLEEYYQHFVPNVTRIPPSARPLLSAADHRPTNSPPLRLAYCGNPGNKEVLEPTILAVKRINTPERRIVFEIGGMSPSQVAELSGVAEEDQESFGILARGRVPLEESQRIVANAHFSLLVRRFSRCTNAGFPTKFVESLSLGTPVIATPTSDLAQYLINGVNGWVVETESGEEIEQTLRKSLELTSNQLLEFRERSLATAQTDFTPQAMVTRLDELLNATESKNTGVR